MSEPLEATIHLAFAFDVGYEVDLDRAGAMLPVASGHLARRRRTPESIRYRPAPLRLALDASGFALPGAGGDVAAGTPRAELSLFDFGAISLLIQIPVRTTPEGLSRVAGELADPGPITAAARLVLAPWLERIRPSIVEYELSDFSEEFVVFQLGETRADWLVENAAWVAGLVRLEPGPMGAEEVVEATRKSLSYAPNDLVVLDWAAGVVADRDCADTIQVIEFANVQLLEFRHIDDRLDDRLDAAYKLIRPKAARRRMRDHGGALRSIRELEIEATSLFERADSSLKLIGDQYLARVYALASSRFHLDEWQRSIRRKLETVGDVYDLLVQQAGVRRMEFLEIVVIVLIALEIVLTIVRH